MTMAYCFQCGTKMLMRRNMESLLAFPLPVFCSIECGDAFPAKGSAAFTARIKKMREKI